MLLHFSVLNDFKATDLKDLSLSLLLMSKLQKALVRFFLPSFDNQLSKTKKRLMKNIFILSLVLSFGLVFLLILCALSILKVLLEGIRFIIHLSVPALAKNRVQETNNVYQLPVTRSHSGNENNRRKAS